MSIGQCGMSLNVLPAVILQPETLIDGVVAIVRRMRDVEVNEVPAVDEA